MKNSAYEESRFKHQLLEKKRNGVKELVWKLNPVQIAFIKRKFGFKVEPYLYEIKTRTFYNVRNLDNFLKDIHYRNKRGKQFTVMKLTPYQRDVLDELEIKYRPYKYKITLNE